MNDELRRSLEAGVIIDRIPDTFRAVPAEVDVARRADEARAAAGLTARAVPQPTHGDLTRAYSATPRSGRTSAR